MYQTLHPFPTIIESINCLSPSDLKQALFNANNLIKIIRVKKERVFLQCGTVANADCDYVLKWQDYWYGLLFYRDYVKFKLKLTKVFPIIKEYMLFPDWTKNRGLNKQHKILLAKNDPTYYKTIFK